MEWAPHFVAKCPVVMFEAAQGSLSWNSAALIGELHITLLENAFIQLQLCDLLDGQALFEYTLSDPAAFGVLTPKFFALRHENGSHKGFGFTNKVAAREMKRLLQKSVDRLASDGRSLQSHAPDSKSDRQATRPRWKKRRIRFKGLQLLTHLFDENVLEIGYPTDVKHVAHIGWDGHSNAAVSSSTKSFARSSVDASVSGIWAGSTGCRDLQPPPPPPKFTSRSSKNK